MKDIVDYLFSKQDLKYKDFNSSLSPTLSPDVFIGVRTPVLRDYAKKIFKESPDTVLAFMNELPHKYFEENQLHAFLISFMKNYDDAITATNRFLPYVDNWATCDQLRPKAFNKHKDELLVEINKWIRSNHTYTIRYAIGMLMAHFLDDKFDSNHLKLVSEVKSDEYYINMMIAWYFATAMAKQYEATVPYIENRILPEWVHRKTISKCVDSFRITPEQKEYLKTFRK